MSDARRPRATVVGAFLEGWRRVLDAPALVLGTWFAATLATLPLAGLLLTDARPPGTWAADALVGIVPSAPAGPAAVVGREVHDIGGAIGTAVGVRGTTGAVRFAIAAAAGVHVLLWIFVSGVASDRLARGRPIGATAAAGLGTRYVFRLIRLAIVAAIAYWIVFRTIHPLLGPLFASSSNGPALVSGALLALVAVVVDFARVRLVVEDRHSVLAAMAAALRFVGRRPLRCAGLYGMNLLALAILVRLWTQAAGDIALPAWAALATVHAFVLLRVATRLARLGAEVVFFQGELAHATYAAAPVPRWPESASIEAIRNLRR